MKRIAPFIFMTLCAFEIMSQDPPPDGLVSEALRAWLRDNWYIGEHNSVGYNNAREQMYSYIDNEGGNVYCAYSGFFQESEFTTYLNPINAEHTVPQALFSSNEPMKSDIHHLFPTHQDVNSARGNLPFADIDDVVTDNWYIGDANGIMTESTIPSFNIDQYSERDISIAFEPREDQKGNTARAIFYFYTMYPTQAGNIFQLGEVSELYEWHIQDPVDDQELSRNEKIREVQGNYNPYISMPELVQLAWDLPSAIKESNNYYIQVYPNPVGDRLTISGGQQFNYEILNLQGRTIQIGQTDLNIDLSELNPGIYLLNLSSASIKISRKLVKI